MAFWSFRGVYAASRRARSKEPAAELQGKCYTTYQKLVGDHDSPVSAANELDVCDGSILAEGPRTESSRISTTELFVSSLKVFVTEVVLSADPAMCRKLASRESGRKRGVLL